MARTSESSSEPSAERGAAGHFKLLLSLHLPALAIGLGNGLVTPVLPILAQSFGVSVGTAALLFVMNMAGGVAASLPAGYIADRFGRRWVLLAGPIIAALAAFLIATANSFEMVLVYRFIGGWGQQMWTLSRLAVIADTGGNRARGRQITSMFGVQRVGTLAGPLVGGLLATFVGLGWPFVLQGLVILVGAIPSFALIRETMPSRTPGRRKSPEEDAAVEYSWRTLLQHPVPILFFAQYLATLSRGAGMGGGVVLLFAAFQYGSNATTLGALQSAMAVVGIPVTLLAGFLMDRFGRKVSIVPGLVLLGGAMIFLGLVALWSLSFTAFVVGFVWMHTFTSLLSGSMQTVGTDIAPRHARGRFFGAGRMVSQAGFMSTPLSFSVLVSVSGYTAAFSFLGFAGLASSLVLGFLIKETLHRE